MKRAPKINSALIHKNAATETSIKIIYFELKCCQI